MDDILKLKQLRTKLDLTQDKLAEELGISKSLVVGIERGERNISLKLLKKIQEKYGIDLFSEGNTKSVPCQQDESNIVSLAYYPDTKAAAGLGKTLPDSDNIECLHFDKRWLKAVIGHNPENLSLIRAEGNSMQPTINNGDLLMVDSSIKEVIPNKIFIIKQEDEYRVKRLKSEFNGDVLIISDNPDYPTEIMNKETTIIGQVVWNGSKENL